MIHTKTDMHKQEDRDNLQLFLSFEKHEKLASVGHDASDKVF